MMYRMSLIGACALFATVTQVHADLYFEDFEGVTPPAVPSGWTARPLGGSSDPKAVVALTTESAAGNPSQNLLLSVDSTNAAVNWNAVAEFRWSGTLPTDDLSKLRLTADVAASEPDKDLVIHFWSYSDLTFTNLTGKADWGGTMSTTYSEVGGLLTEFNAGPTALDTSANAFLIAFRMNQLFGQDAGNEIRIDNIRLSVIPEPGMLTPMAFALTVIMVRRRQRGRALAGR